jgi:prepilin-type N-terminal cleavage/methylation domain-containing protein
MFRLVRANTSGYTFIELLIALALLGIVVAPLLNLFATGYSFIGDARKETTALNLCRTRLEEMRAMGYTAVCVQYLDSSSLPVSEFNPLGLDGFTRRTNVTLVELATNNSSNPSVELLQIDVTVTWHENNRDYEETLSTYLAHR